LVGPINTDTIEQSLIPQNLKNAIVTESSKEFLQSLHPLLPNELVAVQNPDMEVHKTPCCYVLRDKQEKKYKVKLNDTGALIWALCEEARNLGEINQLLAEAFEVDLEDMSRDVSRVVDYLLEENALIESRSA
jgi:hypothetical protein